MIDRAEIQDPNTAPPDSASAQEAQISLLWVSGLPLCCGLVLSPTTTEASLLCRRLICARTAARKPTAVSHWRVRWLRTEWLPSKDAPLDGLAESIQEALLIEYAVKLIDEVSYESICHKSWELKARDCDLHHECFTVPVGCRCLLAAVTGNQIRAGFLRNSECIITQWRRPQGCFNTASGWELVQRWGRQAHNQRKKPPSEVKQAYRITSTSMRAAPITYIHISYAYLGNDLGNL